MEAARIAQRKIPARKGGYIFCIVAENSFRISKGIYAIYNNTLFSSKKNTVFKKIHSTQSSDKESTDVRNNHPHSTNAAGFFYRVVRFNSHKANNNVRHSKVAQSPCKGRFRCKLNFLRKNFLMFLQIFQQQQQG